TVPGEHASPERIMIEEAIMGPELGEHIHSDHALATNQIYRELFEASSMSLSRSVINSLGAHIAVLDESGTIIAVNQAWECFARENGDPDLAYTGVSTNYLEICRSAADSCPEAEQALHG